MPNPQTLAICGTRERGTIEAPHGTSRAGVDIRHIVRGRRPMPWSARSRPNLRRRQLHGNADTIPRVHPGNIRFLVLFRRMLSHVEREILRSPRRHA